MKLKYIPFLILGTGVLSAMVMFNSCDKINAQTPVYDIQLGTSADDKIQGIAADNNGCTYVAGFTSGAISGVNAGQNDVYVIKYDSTNNELWRRQYGTDKDDFLCGITIDSSGTPYIAGSTCGSWFSDNMGDEDAFVAKINPINGDIVWGVQTGTAGYDCYNSIGVYGQSLYVIGDTQCAFFAPNPPNDSGTDVVIAKYQQNGNLVWGRQFGDGGACSGSALAFDSQGNIFFTGKVQNLFSPGRSLSVGDVFVAKYNSSGDLIWGMQYGTDLGDWGRDIKLASDGSIYVLSNMNLDTPFTEDYIQLSKFNSAGTTIWNQQLSTSRTDDTVGYSGVDDGSKLAIDDYGNIFVAGDTGGALFGSNNGNYDAFVVKYSSSGTQLWGYQFGTNAADDISGIICHADGSITVVGNTNGDLFDTNAGGIDNYVSVIFLVNSPTFSPPGGTYSQSQTVTLNTSTSVSNVRYTTDGNEPTDQSQAYSAPLTITQTATVKTRAWKDGYITSDTATAVYTIQ